MTKKLNPILKRKKLNNSLPTSSKVSSKSKKEKEFKKVLAEIESPQDWGNGSWALPRNATTAEKVKYEICEKLLAYQQDNNLTDEVMARKIHLTQSETEDILFCRISKFTLDYLINIASQLFTTSEVGLTIEPKKRRFSRATI